MSPPKLPVDLILSKLAEDVDRAQDRVQKASDVLLGPLNTAIATTPYDVIYTEDRVKLKHYRPVTKSAMAHPLLVVYALINRETMLDLQPGRSVVQGFLNAGVDLYMIDWGYPTRKDRYLSIDDHVNGYMDNIIDVMRDRLAVEKINLMGICMGGTFSVIYACLHPEKINNLVTTVTPTNFDTDKGLLHLWMKTVDADQMTDTFGNIPGDLMNLGFLLLNPARLMLDKYVGLLENMDNHVFMENFIRMEKWIFDSPDVPGEVFRQFITDFYQQNLLIKSKLEVGGQRVDLKKLTMPLLNIFGKFDHLVPPEACSLLTARVGSTDTEDLCLDTGHIGIYVSSKYQKEFTPKIVSWLTERDQKIQQKRKPAKQKASAASAKKAPARRKAGAKSSKVPAGSGKGALR